MRIALRWATAVLAEVVTARSSYRLPSTLTLCAPTENCSGWKGTIPAAAGAPEKIRIRIFALTDNPEGHLPSIFNFIPSLNTYTFKIPP